MQPVFRQLKKEDNTIIASIIRSVLEEHGMNKPGTVYTDPTTDDLHTLFQMEGSYYLVVQLEGEIVGGGGIYPTPNLPDGCVELVKLYLTASARGHGIGKKLIELSSEKARAFGYTTVYLESMPELNNAVGLYESLGFKRINAPLGDSGHYACDLWMIKDL